MIIEGGIDLTEDARILRDKAKMISEQAAFLSGDLSDVSRFLFEMMITRIVDNFEFYICQILESVLRKHPEALGNSQISVRDLIECRDLSEAISSAIEKKVHDLSFQGLDSVFDFLINQRGAPLSKKTPHYKSVLELLEVRHIIVHNNGNISRKFLRKTQRTDLKLGEPFPLDARWVADAFDSMATLVQEFDTTLFAHFDLSRNNQGQREDRG